MRTYLVAIIAISLFSCKSTTKYHYAIRDFDKRLQPYLEQLVSRGILDSNLDLQDTLENELDEEDLHKLSNCEIPILRAFGMFTLIHLKKEKAEQLDVAFSHLDDTATVDVYMGEFGIYRFSVSDYLLNNFNAKIMDSMLSKKLVCELLQNRPYLRSTYSSTDNLKMRPEYYPLIKKLVVEDKKPALIYEDFEGGEAENMLLKLAAFQKATDTTLIRIRLEEYFANWGKDSFSYLGVGYLFEIFKKYPHPEYAVPIGMLVDLMIKYPIEMDEEDPYPGFSKYDANLESYFAAVAAQRNDNAKHLLARLLQHYQALTSEVESRSQRSGKKALGRLKSFIEAHDYVGYKSLLQKL